MQSQGTPKLESCTIYESQMNFGQRGTTIQSKQAGNEATNLPSSPHIKETLQPDKGLTFSSRDN